MIKSAQKYTIKKIIAFLQIHLNKMYICIIYSKELTKGTLLPIILSVKTIRCTAMKLHRK